MPFLAATVAAPIRKLWLEKLPLIPAEDKMSRNYEVSKARDKGRLSRNRNKGPGASPLRVKYASRGRIAQRGNSPLPMCRKQPLRNGSVFEALMRSRKHDGDDMESIAISASPKWMEGEKLARFGTVNSAERRKPK